MKRLTMMMVAGIATLGSMTAARAQAPDTGPPTAAPPATLPTTIPDNAEPASPQAPIQPGTIPPMGSPDAMPPPAPMPQPVVVPAPAPNPYAIEGAHHYPVWIQKMGSAIMVGGGYENFTQSAPKAATNAGGSWNLRLAAGTRQFIGLEAAYVGAARSVNSIGFTPNSTLVSNGLEGNFRLNVPVQMGLALIEPFGFIGLGWQHYHLSKQVLTADVTATDDVMTMPYGGGVMFAYDMLMVDARVTFRETYYNNMFSAEGSKLNTWGVGGNIGVEF
jgi:hypothetical protein